MIPERCACCGGANGCMFETGVSLRARTPTSRLNQDNLHLREMQMLFKFREGPGFAVGYHEERRASALIERGWLKGSHTIYRSRYDRQGQEIIEYRNKYTITDAGKAALTDHEKRGSRA